VSKTVLRPEIKAAVLTMQKRMEENSHKDGKTQPEVGSLMVSAMGQINNAYFADNTEYMRQSLTDCMVYCALALSKLPRPAVVPKKEADR
jgi:hypothetical protein